MAMGAGSPEQFVSILCVQNAGLSRRERSLVLPSSQEGLKFADVAANMRGLFGSFGGAVREGVLVTETVDGPPGGDGVQKVCVTYKKAEKREVGQKQR